MRIKTFQGPSVQEALQQAKHEMGTEAVILQTREVKARGILGIGSKTCFEIVVGTDASPAAPARPQASADTARQAAVDAVAYHQLKDLQDEVRRMRQLMNQPRPQQNLDGKLDEQTLRNLFAGRVAAPSEGRCVIALIGPTGVGKTTTLAKLAAKYVIEQQKRVGLITLDTFRIGAVEQLRTYARIIGVPLEVALSPADLSSAVNRLADRDVVLIDTVGRCQKNKLQLSELQMFLDAAKPSEVHLVISASSSLEVQRDVVRNFGILAPNRLIYTKVDEAVGLKCIADVALSTRLPLSYITNGQNVPDDIHPADPDGLAKLVVEAA